MKTPDETGQKIINLWLEGLTGSEIGDRLGMTRSAVLGKIHRLRQYGHLSYKNPQKKETTSSQFLDVNAEPPPIKKKRGVARVDIREIMSRPKPPVDGVRFMDLTSRSCRYVLNNGVAKDYVFCGKRKKLGPYCEEHARLCYVPTEKKKIAKQPESKVYRYGV